MSILHRVLTTAGIVLAVMLIITISVDAQQITSSGKKGSWRADSTWVGGVLPGSTNTVLIAPGDSVNVDSVRATIAGLTVGDASGAASRLRFSAGGNVHLAVNGNFTIASNALVQMQSSSTGADLADTLELSGNFTSNGTFDFVTGSAGSTKHVVRIIFVGSTNSTITSGPYTSSSINEFGGFTFRKTGGARVILNNDVFLAGGSSTTPANLSPAVNPFLYFESGLVEAINGTLVGLWTTDTSWKDYGPHSYVIGTAGRGMAQNSGATRTFPVGDEYEYRPVTVRTTMAAGATGEHIRVSVIRSNANNGSSTFSPAINKVSSVRYYKVSFNKTFAGGDFVGVDRFKLSYGKDEGIGVGNVDLRIAVADTNRSKWTGLSQLVDDTTYSPDFAIQDSMAVDTLYSVSSGKRFIYLALARLATTTTNTLDFSTSVEDEATVPSAWVLGQNYPNPFNPSTKISYGVPANGYVSLAIFNLLGQRVATLFEGMKAAGTHTAVWNGRDASGRVVPSGVYIYRMEGGGVSQAKRMILMK